MGDVQLTAGNSEGALLPVKRVEFEVHWTSKSQRHPAEREVGQWRWKIIVRRSQWEKTPLTDLLLFVHSL